MHTGLHVLRAHRCCLPEHDGFVHGGDEHVAWHVSDVTCVGARHVLVELNHESVVCAHAADAACVQQP